LAAWANDIRKLRWRTAGDRARRAIKSRSGRELFVFALHQFPDFLERLVERSTGNMVVGGVDGDTGARIGFAQRAQEALIRGSIALDVILQMV